MAIVVYLDVEDEITTAATRIRTAAGPRVGLVLPFGSRVATSRINFRLLAREAQANGRRLDIVAPDAATRALAASAGLPVFASVGEYEAALASLEAAGEVETPVVAAAQPVVAPPARRWTPASAAALGPAAVSEPASIPAPRPVDGSGRRTAATEVPRADVPLEPSRRGGAHRGLVVFALLLLVLVLAGGGIAAAMLLPSATITITPRVEDVAPVSITVTADPTATAVDIAGAIIPATVIQIPVSTKADFPATGKKVTETSGAGQVRLDSINTVFPVSVARGTRVSTLDGIVFQTTAAVVVPRATVSLNTIHHGFVSVGIAAVKGGTAGNVDAGTITEVPGTLATEQISVTNLAPTTGGTHTEQVLVAKKDVDAAMAQLTKDLGAQFATQATNPAGVPAGATLYATTAKLGAAAPTVDPASLVGTTADTFSLGLDATGTVLAVDPSPIQSIGEAAIRGAVTSGYAIVEGSLAVTVGDGTVAEDGSIRIPVQGTARQTRPLDVAALKSKVLGLSASDTRAALAAYGAVDVALWPGWVTAVPSSDGRVTITVNAAVQPSEGPSTGPGASPKASAPPRASASPSASASASAPASTQPSSAPSTSSTVSPVPSG